MSFPTPDQVEVTLRMRFIKLRGSPTLSFPTPDQVEGDVKDMIYQLRESPFFKDEIPNQVGNDSFVIFIVILTHIIRY
jgi:hypothetical protein